MAGSQPLSITHTRSNTRRIGRAILLAAAAIGLGACAKTMGKPDQGIYGTFIVYGPRTAESLQDCEPFQAQEDRDTCKKQNAKVADEPFQGSILIRNMTTAESLSVALDANGSYRMRLKPGEYLVCVLEECSDPLNVPMNSYVTYGQRLPKRKAEEK